MSPSDVGDLSAPADESLTPQVALERLLEPVLAALGFELCHLEWSSSGRHRNLRVYIDRAAAGETSPGVGIDDCARLSPVISNALDAAEQDPAAASVAKVLAAPYVLEVSSPGLDRPLSRRDHFERFVGRSAIVKTRTPIDSTVTQKTFHGRIAGTQPDPSHAGDPRRGSIELVDDAGQTFRIPLALIRRANLVFEG